jgi:CheY-like chemotaxis protein
VRDLRLLLVEDSAVDAWMVSRGLRDVPCAALKSVKDGQEAMDYLEGKGDYGNREKYPLPHMILLDLKMPRVSGFDFLKWLREQAPQDVRIIPVIVLSGSDLQEDVRKAYKLGANRFVAKTPDINLFARRLKHMAESWTDSELPHRRAGGCA